MISLMKMIFVVNELELLKLYRKFKELDVNRRVIQINSHNNNVLCL